jgi:type III restriction enzyme
VGKRGEPGEFVRCVVSVAMLTEGWDANNVTHILGLRAFNSQLLCEQVVGRGLRRLSYVPDPKTGLLTEEYADVYGIPFSLIPFKGRPENAPALEDRPNHRVYALDARKEMEIRFPIVNGYVFETTRGLLKCDVERVEPLDINPRLEPTATYLAPPAGFREGIEANSPFPFIQHDRNAYHQRTHLQTILFQIAQLIVDDFLAPTTANTTKRSRVFRLQSRHLLFPQVLGFVKEYVATRVNFNDAHPCELGLQTYTKLVVERLREAIYPDSTQGEPPLLPILDHYRPVQSTSVVDFGTARPTVPIKKSHLNAVVQDSPWEAEAARLMDECDAVRCYARNDHLGLAVRYEYLGIDHDYEPDFLVCLVNETRLLLEIKGFEGHEPEKTNQKHEAAKRWVQAVNNLGDFGRWEFHVCRDLDKLKSMLGEIVNRTSAFQVSA